MGSVPTRTLGPKIKSIPNGSKWTISSSDGFGLLQMVSEPDTTNGIRAKYWVVCQ